MTVLHMLKYIVTYEKPIVDLFSCPISSIACAYAEGDIWSRFDLRLFSATFSVLRVSRLSGHCLTGKAVERVMLEASDGCV